jgi:ribosomal protein S18 acetylase RimI-like enzyme
MLQIRKADYRDAAGLAHIQVDSYRSAYAEILPAEFLSHFSYVEQTQDWLNLIDSEGPAILLVAENEAKEICGYALGTATSPNLPGCDGELDALHVRADLRGQGIGRELVRAMAIQLRQAGCKRMGLWVLTENKPAREFYERLGGHASVERTILLGEADTQAGETSYIWSAIDELCGPE